MAAHTLVFALAVGATISATISPAQRAVNQAFEQLSIEEAANGAAPFARSSATPARRRTSRRRTSRRWPRCGRARA